MQVPEAEEETQAPALDDDGFESLDGNGSCDSNKEEQDISLTAEEFESVLKSSPVHGDAVDNKLVFKTCCPKFSKPQTGDNVSLINKSRSTQLEPLALSTSTGCVDQLTAVDDECIRITPLEDKETLWREECPSSAAPVVAENANSEGNGCRTNNLSFGSYRFLDLGHLRFCWSRCIGHSECSFLVESI